MTTLALTTCTIRPWRLDDLESLLRHADNPRVSQYLRDAFPSPYTRTDGEQWLAIASADEDRTGLAIEGDGVAVGGIGVRRRCGEIGYWLGEPYWGRGIATEAVGAMTAWGIERFDLVRVEAQVYAPNAASARVLEKNGFSQVQQRAVTLSGGNSRICGFYLLKR